MLSSVDSPFNGRDSLAIVCGTVIVPKLFAKLALFNFKERSCIRDYCFAIVNELNKLRVA
jgi:hypothetical protein